MKLSKVLNGVLAVGLLLFSYVIYHQARTIESQKVVMLEMYMYIQDGCPTNH
jgi:hypothetical protein